MRITYSLDLPAEAQTVPVVRAIVRSTMTELGVDPDCVDDLALALTEACANVVAHATADGAIAGAAGYTVEICFDREVCEIQVTDQGGGFDASHLRIDMPGGDAERGRGLAIIETLMDSVAFASEPGGGTVVTFEKKLVLTPESKLRPFAPPA